MSKELIEEVLASSKENILKSVKTSIQKDIEDSVSNKIRWTVEEVVNDYLKEEIVPVVRQLLIDEKDAIVEVAYNTSHSIIQELHQAITTQVAKNLASSWNVKKVIEVILGS